jgi:tRNA(Ile2) C34 agmatinyltransferase TiaS
MMKRCPKCGGQMLPETDGSDWFCLQCGYRTKPAVLLEYDREGTRTGPKVKPVKEKVNAG